MVDFQFVYVSKRCETDVDCESVSHQCCVDVSSLSQWSKTCCSSTQPLILPNNINNLNQTQLNQLDSTISSMSPVFLDLVVCEGLQYSMMERLSSCSVFLTTTARLQQLPQTDLASPLTSSITFPVICLTTLAAQ